MDDPLRFLFGVDSLELFRAKQLRVVHGDFERLPEWMRVGTLSSIERLCHDYSGPLQVAQGKTTGGVSVSPSFVGAGGQTPVSGAGATVLLRLGLSVYFGNLERTVRAAESFLRGIERALGTGECMRLSAFANAPGSGLPLHHDTYDQLLIHLIGSKKLTYREWRDANHPHLSYSPSGPVPAQFEAVYRNGFSDATSLDERELVTASLRPGSCVFMPAGTWHRTEDQDEPCLSLTTAVRVPSRLDLLMRALSGFLSQSEEWRAPAYGALAGAADEYETRRMESLLDALPERMSHLDARALRQAWHISAIDVGAVESFPVDEEFDRYVRLPSSEICLESTPEKPGMMRVLVRVFQKPMPAVLEMDEGARPVIEWMLNQRRVFSLDELARQHADFELDDLAVLAIQLCQVGFLRPAPSLAWE